MNGSPAAAAFDTPKLRAQTEVLERRLDELTATLDNAISDIEAGALEPRLSCWLAWVVEKRRSGVVTVAVAGAGADADVAGAGSQAIAVVLLDLPAVLADAFVLGDLRRECAGLIAFGAGALPPDLADVFRESPLGICQVPPPQVKPPPRADDMPWSGAPVEPGAPLGALIARVLPAAALAPAAGLVHARLLVELAAGVQTEHARENARLALQATIAERGKGSHALGDELAARRELTAQLRDDLNRDLQGPLDKLGRAAAQLDSDLLLRGPAKRAMDAIPALATAGGQLVHVGDFEKEDRFHWWTGTSWEKFDALFPHKMRLTIPSADLAKLSADLSAQLNAIVAKQALRVVEGFNASVEDFADAAAAVGVKLRAAEIDAGERARWDRKGDAALGGSARSGTFGAAGISLRERCKRAIDATCEKDVKAFHVDIDRRGPIGRIMEARTAVMGLSFLVMTGIRVSSAWGQIEKWLTASARPGGAAAGDAAHGIPWNLIFNAALIGVFFIFLGLIVNAVTEHGKEGAQISEKVHEAREALEDKLVAVMERFVATELADLKAVLVEHKAAALERLDRALDAQKQEIEEIDRKSRGAAPMRTARPGLAALPIGLKSDVEKVLTAAKDVRTELTARYAALALPAPAVAPAAGAPATAAAPAAPVAPAAVRPDTSAAMAALAARMAARAAATAAAAQPARPAPEAS